MTLQRLTHGQREQEVMNDLERHFPGFAGEFLAWTKVPDDQDPPDFLAQAPTGTIGLEFIEWLDGSQMAPAKGREAQRKNIFRVLGGEQWENKPLPRNVVRIFLTPVWNQPIAPADEAALREQFYACAEGVDAVWLTNPDRIGSPYSTYYQARADLSDYPTLAKYIETIRYDDGQHDGYCWIDIEEDGGLFDPTVAIQTLERALDKKLTLYSTPEKQAQLKARGLAELSLLVHGGFNAYRYNMPHRPISLDRIASRGAEFYARHPQGRIFKRVWFFDSLNSSDDMNALLGLPPGYGDLKWLAQLWPLFVVDPRSSGG